MTVSTAGESCREVAGRPPLVTLAEASAMADRKKTELASRSDDLLEAVQRLKETERAKRQEPISSESFHRLANEVDALSHEVFAIARDQDGLGERIPRSDESIADVAEQSDGDEAQRDAAERTGS
jgi:hypothetical protein